MPRRCSALIAGLAITACGPADDRSAATTDLFGTTARDSAGVRIVDSVGAGRIGPMVARETLRLGTEEGGGPKLFSQVHALALGPAGELVVGNNASATVRVFDWDGAFLAEFSGRGQGPSEVSGIQALVVAGDTVAVADWNMGRVVVFTLDGTYVDSWASGQPGGSAVNPVHRTPEGWLASGRATPMPTVSRGARWIDSTAFRLLDFDADTLGSALYAVPGITLYGVEGGHGADWGLIPEMWHRGFDGEGRLYLTDPHAYRVDVLENGRPTRSVRRSHSPRSLTADDIKEIRAAGLHTIDTTSTIPDADRPAARRSLADRLERQAALPMPNAVPPLGQVLVSPDGSFWVERVDTGPVSDFALSVTFGFWGRVPAIETTWDLFDSEGSLLGAATLPRRFRAEAVRGSRSSGSSPTNSTSST